VSPLQYDYRSYKVGQIKVQIGMHGSVLRRYGNVSYTLNINEIACLSRATGNVSCIPAGVAYPSRRSIYLCGLRAERTNAVSC
jgi:hypothetical protein